MSVSFFGVWVLCLFVVVVFLVGEGFSACFVVLSFQWPVGQSLICIVYKVHIG